MSEPGFDTLHAYGLRAKGFRAKRFPARSGTWPTEIARFFHVAGEVDNDLGETDRSSATVEFSAGVKEGGMATRERRYGPGGGITLGGIIVIVGIVLMFVWSFWIGLIIAVVGLVFFGGFARGRWY
jgi:hypothetical protein